MRSFRKDAKMETKINSLKISRIDEEDIYRRYINRENTERGKGEIGLKGVKSRVNYLNTLVERYLALW